MPIDPSAVQWDPIDPAQIQWDDAPARKPAAKPVPKPAAAKKSGTDFSNVRGTPGATKGSGRMGGIQSGWITSEGSNWRNGMQSLGTLAEAGPGALTAINRRNNADWENGGRAQYQKVQQDARRKEFQSLPAPARFMIGLGEPTSRAISALGQAGGAITDATAPKTLEGLIGGAGAYDQAMRREQARRDVADVVKNDLAGGAGAVGGDIAYMWAPGNKIAGISGVSRYLGALGLGGAYGAAQPVVDEESRGVNAGVSAAFSLLGQGGTDLLMKSGRAAAGAVPELKRQLIEIARKNGIPLHASQISDSWAAKTVASMGKYLPFSGATKAAANQQEAFNRALGRQIGVDAPKLTDEVVSGARKDISRQFEDIYARNSVPVGAEGARKLASVESGLAKRLTRDEADVVRAQMDDILAELDDAGALSGQKYQALRTQIMKAETPDRVGNAVKELRRELDAMANKAFAGKDGEMLAKARAQWANLKTIEGLLKQAAGSGGDIKPANVWAAIRNGSTPEMRQLGRLGQQVLKDPIPDSGTAGRALLANALNPFAWPVAIPTALAGATAGRLANSSRFANLLARPGAGQTRQLVAPAARRLLPAVAPVVAPQAQGKKRDKDKKRTK